jgi:hypothetical protein
MRSGKTAGRVVAGGAAVGAVAGATGIAAGRRDERVRTCVAWCQDDAWAPDDDGDTAGWPSCKLMEPTPSTGAECADECRRRCEAAIPPANPLQSVVDVATDAVTGVFDVLQDGWQHLSSALRVAVAVFAVLLIWYLLRSVATIIAPRSDGVRAR